MAESDARTVGADERRQHVQGAPLIASLTIPIGSEGRSIRKERGDPLASGLVAVLLGMVILCLILPFGPEILWVGSTDLRVAFAVTDAQTGEPLPGATVQVHSDGAFPEDRPPWDLTVTTDSEGVASCRPSKTRTCGRGSVLPWRNTFSVYVPIWTYQVHAPGYAPSERIALHPPDHSRMVRRTKVGAELTIPVALDRSPARPRARRP
jgi:hypothetical protein